MGKKSGSTSKQPKKAKKHKKEGEMIELDPFGVPRPVREFTIDLENPPDEI